MRSATISDQQDAVNQDIQAIRDFSEILSDIIIDYYNSIEKGSVKGVAVVWKTDKCSAFSFRGDFITDSSYKDEFYDISKI
jgi:hypothetical protein